MVTAAKFLICGSYYWSMLKNLLSILLILMLLGCKPVSVQEPEEVSEAPLYPSYASQEVVARGTLDTASTQGKVCIVKEQENYKLVVKDLQSKLTPDLRFYLVTATGEKIDVHKFEEEPVGDFEFDLSITDASDIVAVELYCVFCEASFGRAELE